MAHTKAEKNKIRQERLLEFDKKQGNKDKPAKKRQIRTLKHNSKTDLKMLQVLVDSKEYTVTEICQKLKIGRTAFYRNYALLQAQKAGLKLFKENKIDYLIAMQMKAVGQLNFVMDQTTERDIAGMLGDEKIRSQKDNAVVIKIIQELIEMEKGLGSGGMLANMADVIEYINRRENVKGVKVKASIEVETVNQEGNTPKKDCKVVDVEAQVVEIEQ